MPLASTISLKTLFDSRYPGREQLDHLIVADGDDKDGRCGGRRHVVGEMGMLTERKKRLLWTVTGGGQAVGAEAYPGEKRDQGYVLARLVAERIQRAPNRA